MSLVWEYAIKRRNPHRSARSPCSLRITLRSPRCNKIIKCSRNSTTLLKNHNQLHISDVNKSTNSKTSREEIVNKKALKTMMDFL